MDHSRDQEAALDTETTTSSAPVPSQGKRRWVWSWGPGLVFTLAAIGPSDFVSNSVTGATYGYSLLWALPIIVAARYFILEASARYVLVTGESIFVGYGRCGRWVVWLIFAASLLRQHFSVLYMTLLMGGALQMVMPLPGPWAQTTWSLLCWSTGFGLMYLIGTSDRGRRNRSVQPPNRDHLITVSGIGRARCSIKSTQAGG